MTDELRKKARIMLAYEEGVRKYPYRCTAGKLSIGIGRNLEAKPLSDRVIDQMFDEDLLEASISARKIFGEKFLESISDNQRLAIINLIFNLGEAGFLTFQRMISAMRGRRWLEAADELRDSKYYTQVTLRAERVIDMLTRSRFPYE